MVAHQGIFKNTSTKETWIVGGMQQDLGRDSAGGRGLGEAMSRRQEVGEKDRGREKISGRATLLAHLLGWREKS